MGNNKSFVVRENIEENHMSKKHFHGMYLLCRTADWITFRIYTKDSSVARRDSIPFSQHGHAVSSACEYADLVDFHLLLLFFCSHFSSFFFVSKGQKTKMHIVHYS